MVKNLFISYAPRDHSSMLLMREHLLSIHYKPWIDPEPRPGQEWRFAIDEALRGSDAVLVIVTPAAAESVYVTYEWALALGANLPVIPVIFKPAKLHPRLQSMLNFDVNAFREPDHFWDYFKRELPRVLDTASQAAVSPAQPAEKPPTAAAAVPINRDVMPTESGYYLVIRRGPQPNRMFRLAKELLTLGRDSTNDITIDDAEISRYHLRLHWRGDGYAIEDLNSTNGTRIDGRRIHDVVPLRPGQVIALGDAVILTYEAVSG